MFSCDSPRMLRFSFLRILNYFFSLLFPAYSLRYFSYFLQCVLILLSTIPAHAAQVTLQWDANAEPHVAGYRLYCGTASRVYSLNIDVGNMTSCTISNLEDGKTYYFAATAYDTSYTESGYSNELFFTSPQACTYSISPLTQSFGSSGGAGIIDISTQSGCPWSAISNSSCLTITSNSSGTGNGVINYSVLGNPSTSSRTGNISIAGQIFSATQSGIQMQYNLTIINAGTGAGTVTANPVGTTYNAGTMVTLTAAPDANSTFSGWTGGCAGTLSNCPVTMNANTSVTATFAVKTYTITTLAGSNGSIFPQGSVFLNYGASQTFTITPNAGYKVANVKINGTSVGAMNSYTFNNINSNSTIAVTFTTVKAIRHKYSTRGTSH